ncbi:MAG: response regulator transcription factor [Bryobacteraceae bacterium]|nr:response regulator transcription factor [Bryobacteraceae bacterium]
MLRTGLETLVRNHPELELISVADAAEDIRAKSVDVLVALETGIEGISAEEGSPAVVLIWPQVEIAQLRAALRAGVRAVLPQDCTSAELTSAIQAAAAGLTVLRSSDLEALPLRNGGEQVSLSPRELEVLRLVADGLANKEISYRLGISEHTVKFHVNSILTKLNASTRAEAVAIGMRQGLILL